MTKYPFAMPSGLLEKLPKPSRDGNCYLDVRFGGRWDGIVVVDSKHMCIGIYVQNGIEEYPLPFSVEDIEDIRPASWLNLMLGRYPFDFYSTAVIAIVFISPIFLGLGWTVWPWSAFCSMLICSAGIYTMYSMPGFPFTRLPVAIFGLGQIIYGGMILFANFF